MEAAAPGLADSRSQRRRLQRRRIVTSAGVFPNDAAMDRLVSAVIVEAHDEWRVTDRRYLSETSMARLRQDEPTRYPRPPAHDDASPAEPR